MVAEFGGRANGFGGGENFYEAIECGFRKAPLWSKQTVTINSICDHLA